jgi:tetratricopeptide (TPR) repeat protein
MKRAFTASTVAILVALLLSFGCRSSADTTTSETQRQFGVRMARMNLWREAMFRFKRAVEINPDDAMAHNNLAVALEANGDFDGAAKEYREAMRLDRSNEHIQKNYSRFVEFTQKAKKRQEKRPVTTATISASDTAAPVPAPQPPAAAPPPSATPATATTTTATATTTTAPPGGSQ